MSGDEIEILSDKCFLEYIYTIYSLTGITIGLNRKAMVQGRLRKRIKTVGLSSYDEYLNFLKKTPTEVPVFIDLVTTNETQFFRTPQIWEMIQNKIIPEWNAKNANKVFRIWSAASSSGEEAYSLAILCQEFKLKNPGFDYQILGTDISQDMISLCESACYSGRSIEAFRNQRNSYFVKYLNLRKDETYEVVSELRSRVKFKCHNLFQPLKSSPKFDLILLRNVLIYFKQADQEKVLNNAFPLLEDDGFLIIGESESLTHICSPFEMVKPLIYRKGKASGGLGDAA